MCKDNTMCFFQHAHEELCSRACSENCQGSRCRTIRVPYERLIHIIKSGSVPLICIKDSATHGLSLCVHQRRFRDKCVSISHIWADGLGNSLENALPACQVGMLQSILNHEVNSNEPHDYQNFRFRKMLWMGTLCIPVKKEHLELRTQ